MSRPTDIPEDVWLAAGKALGSCQACNCDLCTEEIARAIMAERERCRGIAWNHGAASTDPHESNAGYVIAAAIGRGGV